MFLALALAACGSPVVDSPASTTGTGSITATGTGTGTGTGNLVIKGTVNVTKDSSGKVRYFGEVVNTGTVTNTSVKITFTTYDASNKVVGSDYSYINGNLWMTSYGTGDETALGAAEFGSFEVITSVLYATSNTYEYTITSSSSATPPKYALAITGAINEVTDTSGYKKYLGEVINNGTGTASFVKISFTTKDSSGAVNGTDYTYISGTTCAPSGMSTTTCLAAGGKGSFSVSTWTKTADIASYYYRIYHEEYAVTKPSLAKAIIDIDHDQRLQAWNRENENTQKRTHATK